MCTMVAEKLAIAGSGKGTGGWFGLGQAYVSYDHTFHFDAEHALNLDFVDEAKGPGARVAVELDADSARRLAHAILAALEAGLEREGAGLPA